MTFIAILIASWIHPFHISVTNIYYKEKEKVIQVEQRIFLDDLEEALQDYSGNEKLDIITDDQTELAVLVEKYLAENFTILIKENPVTLVFLGMEQEVDQNVLWCYFEAERIQDLASFKVKNSLLTEKFPDQENIIHFDPKGNTISKRTGLGREWLKFEIKN